MMSCLGAGCCRITMYGALYATAINYFYFSSIHALPERLGKSKSIESSSFILGIIISSIFGARLLSVILYQPKWSLYYSPGVLFFRSSGLCFFGGALGALGCLLVMRALFGVELLGISDVLLQRVPLPIFLVRIGNFLNGEGAGLSKGSLHTHLSSLYVYPQLYEALLEGPVIFLLYRLSPNFKVGVPTGTFCVAYAVFRFTMEFFKEQETSCLGFGLWQCCSLAMFVVGVFILVSRLFQSRGRASSGTSEEDVYRI